MVQVNGLREHSLVGYEQLIEMERVAEKIPTYRLDEMITDYKELL